jgi:hypothetical protein
MTKDDFVILEEENEMNDERVSESLLTSGDEGGYQVTTHPYQASIPTMVELIDEPSIQLEKQPEASLEKTRLV